MKGAMRASELGGAPNLPQRVIKAIVLIEICSD